MVIDYSLVLYNVNFYLFGNAILSTFSVTPGLSEPDSKYHRDHPNVLVLVWRNSYHKHLAKDHTSLNACMVH